MANHADDEVQVTSEPDQGSPNASDTEEVAKELFAVVCKNGGMISPQDALGSLSADAINYINQYGFFPLMQSSLSEVLRLQVEQPGNQATLRVKVDIELCKAYGNAECLSEECARLHVCPAFVKGQCSSEDEENENCNLNHHFSCDHEQEILTKFKLDTLHEGSLLSLLRNITIGQPDAVLGTVEVCAHYNSVPGCPNGFSCLNLHLCTAFAKGECANNGRECAKSHDVLEEKSRLGKNFKTSEQQVIARRIVNFQNLLMLARLTARTQASPPSIDEICGFHLKGNCRYGRLCKKYWTNLPYLWQIWVTLEDDSEKWISFPLMFNQIIEWDFCDVKKDTSFEINIGGQDPLHIYFDEMVAKTPTGNYKVNIRRVSTASWVKASPGDSFATRWTWCWTNDQNQWVAYDGVVGSQYNTAQTSSNEILEEHFTSGAETFTMTINGQAYNIDLKNYQQTNTATGKTRRIRRRPREFFGLKNITSLLLRRRQSEAPLPQSSPSLPPASNITLPQGWSAMTSNQDVVMVALQPGSAQHVRVETEFKKTLGGKTIHKIERVQNLDLWESYSRKLSKLTRKLGRPVEVRQLFHGSDANAMKAICQQGFDWRLSGVHGTAYGKGSYFAVAALYSDGYATVASGTGHKMMFLNKVIVGLYVVGNSSTMRPPPRDPNKPYELYHSCVNNMANPSMFVVFENDQAYPEFLITYS